MTDGALRTFFMEDFLEGSRFRARFNLGESGARHATVRELLAGSGVSDAAASDAFLGTLLRDSPNWGRDDLRDRIAAMHPGATREDVLVTTGTSEALFLLFRQLRPKKLALVVPAFQLLYEIPQSLGS
jgi:aspartate/methionine/tyrosine aminotransferase